MDKCPKCGKELENGITKCPECGTEIPKENVIEEVQVNPNNIISLDDEPKVEETVETKIEPEQTNQQPVPTTETPVTTPEVPAEVEAPQETKIEVTPQEETTIVNESLETVSVDATNIKLEEKKEEVVVEIPEMPEPTIAEISPDLLGNNYDEAERINNEKIEAKRQAELAELERKKQEEEARRQAQAQAGRPDLLAGRGNNEINIDTMPKKKKSKARIIILILLILAAIGFALFYFLVLGEN